MKKHGSLTNGKLTRVALCAIACAVLGTTWLASEASAHDGAGVRRGIVRRALRQPLFGLRRGFGFRRSIVRSCDSGFVGIGYGSLGIGYAPQALVGPVLAVEPCTACGVQTLNLGALGIGAGGYGAIGVGQPIIVERPVFVPVRQRFFERRFFGRRGFRDRGFFGGRGSLRRALAFGLLGAL